MVILAFFNALQLFSSVFLVNAVYAPFGSTTSYVHFDHFKWDPLIVLPIQK